MAVAGSRRPTIMKRQRERDRAERRRQKTERRAQRKVERLARAPTKPGEDPDLAGIVPGPQPPLEED